MNDCPYLCHTPKQYAIRVKNENCETSIHCKRLPLSSSSEKRLISGTFPHHMLLLSWLEVIYSYLFLPNLCTCSCFRNTSRDSLQAGFLRHGSVCHIAYSWLCHFQVMNAEVYRIAWDFLRYRQSYLSY